MAKANDVIRVGLSGGIIGLLTFDAAKSLTDAIVRANDDGWHVIQVIPDQPPNLLVILFRLIILMLTLFLWCPATGYLVILEHDSRR